MRRMNWTRVLFGGLLAGMIINSGEYLLHNVVLQTAWEEARKRFTTPPEQNSIQFLVFSLAGSTFASSPVTPNCLGKDISSFTKISPGFVGSVASSLSSGGFDDEILAHKQGIPGISSCPDYGFPTPLH